MNDQELYVRAKVWVEKWMKPPERDLPSGEPVADCGRDALTKALFAAFKQIANSPEARVGGAAIQLIDAVQRISDQRRVSGDDEEDY